MMKQIFVSFLVIILLVSLCTTTKAGGSRAEGRRRRKEEAGGRRKMDTLLGGRQRDPKPFPLARSVIMDPRLSASTFPKSAQGPTLATKSFKPLYTARERKAAMKSKRPNIILILTDDQDVELGSLQFMPKLKKHIQDEGVYYENGFVSTPMCCPSRSSLLTGLYVHNHNVHTNNDNCSSTYWIEQHEPKTFGTYLQDSGYSTGYFGKYLNKYDGKRVPVGWGEWNGLLRNSRFYNYSLNVNGEIHHHGFDYQSDYLPDIITNRSTDFLRWSKTVDPDSPVMAVLSYPGPHGPEDAAPQYQHLFFNVTTHHTPAYDFAPNPDKQWILRQTDKMQPIHKHFTDILMTKRLQTLQTVDEAVERVVGVLEELGELDNTYIIYTSDHGYHLGQYGLVKGKAFPFDVDTKVPLLVRGPGVPRGVVRAQPIVNIDLAPTFLDMAGLDAPPHMDGVSMLPTLKNTSDEESDSWRSAFMIERGKMTFTRYAKVSDMAAANDVLQSQFKGLTKEERLKIECNKPRYKAPCSPHQKWYCKEKVPGGEIKMKRCRTGIAERFGLAEAKTAKNQCHCKPGDLYGWKFKKLDSAEKRNQRKFLRTHVPEVSKIKHKFLKTLPRGASSFRHSRSADFQLDHGLFQEDVAQDELKEVDGLVEDIAEEIRDLHNRNQTESGCKMDRDNVICTNDIISDKVAWESSRTTIKHQIQRLRAQLNELKQIRKYLRVRRPAKQQTRRGGHSRVLPLNLRAYNLDDDLSAHAHDDAEICSCDPQARKAAERRLLRAERMKRREEKKLEKLRRKEAKRAKQERKERRKLNPKKQDHCKVDVKMNCFSHDNHHWKTAPFWTEGPFCACTNSNNNTYWCVRNVNSTHNYLYCEYVTGMVTYFDMRVDPHQLRNVLHTLTDNEVNFMHNQLIDLRVSGGKQTFLRRKRRLEAARRSAVRPLNLRRKNGGGERMLEQRSKAFRSEKRRAWLARTILQQSKRRSNRGSRRRG